MNTGSLDFNAVPSTSTRDAVESAIDISKEDKSSTWEAIAVRGVKKIAQWGADEIPCEANAKQPPETHRL